MEDIFLLTANWRQESFGAKPFGNLGKFSGFGFGCFFACSGSAFKSLAARCEGDEVESWFIIVYMNEGLRRA